MSHLSNADGQSICVLQGLRISRAIGVDGASFTAFLGREAAVKLSIQTPDVTIVDSDDGTRYRAKIHAVSVGQSAPGSGLASIRGMVRQFI